jgi:hypothetical protein
MRINLIYWFSFFNCSSYRFLNNSFFISCTFNTASFVDVSLRLISELSSEYSAVNALSLSVLLIIVELFTPLFLIIISSSSLCYKSIYVSI